jgi:DNA replication and repair protein RecF
MSFLKIQKLQVRNFRNLHEDIIEFGERINCIFGQNGNGKSNILEAVYFLATKKSFRKNTSFPQLLSIDGEETQIIFSSIFSSEDQVEPTALSGRIAHKSQEWSLNGKPIKRKPPIPIVFVNPFDSYGFHNFKENRRDWFDSHLSQIDENYKKVLKKYQSQIRHRNALLNKKPPHYWEQVQSIDVDLAVNAISILNMRKYYCDRLTELFTVTFREIFSEEHHLSMAIESRWSGLSAEEICEYLKERRNKDEILGYTSYGIHKDDYMLLLDDLNSYEFSSLGQQKMSYLSLLFAYVELFMYKFNSYPILLIDDVSGELDSFRWRKLVSYLREKNFQVLITTANEKFKEVLDTIEDSHQIYVDSGAISYSSPF